MKNGIIVKEIIHQDQKLIIMETASKVKLNERNIYRILNNRLYMKVCELVTLKNCQESACSISTHVCDVWGARGHGGQSVWLILSMHSISRKVRIFFLMEVKLKLLVCTLHGDCSSKTAKIRCQHWKPSSCAVSINIGGHGSASKTLAMPRVQTVQIFTSLQHLPQ